MTPVAKYIRESSSSTFNKKAELSAIYPNDDSLVTVLTRENTLIFYHEQFPGSPDAKNNFVHIFKLVGILPVVFFFSLKTE